ncbi:Spore coat protein CotO [Virgibacillus subterraneus]|uniref:Spore coat protein CotO n=3 Tax=Virgibacillus TaxID=84406 RepID=A0A1H1EK87_9BACI|nr:CotO family spore coat protein [Virgibacillus subterraneus]SDQ89157.1 Spore coat protein CotO [Virgibacillus salinus]SEQ44529.1 Spore coat protein CotO [Virgibacillus subterraneus]
MGEKKFAKSPLLYIHQPSIGTPKAPMQHQYTTPKNAPAEQVVAQETKSVQKRPLRRDHFNKKSDGEAEDTNEEADESDESSDQERKKFKDMTLNERVDYFVNPPKHVPAMKCEVKTEERNYRGTIVDFLEDNVIMRLGRRTSTTEIPFDSINDIRLIGF